MKFTKINTGFLLAVIATALFSLKSIFIKLAYDYDIDALTLLSVRMILSAPIYLLILIYLIYSNKFSKKITLPLSFKIVFLGLLGYYFASLLDLMALELISSQLERLTLFTYPLIITILSWIFLKEKISKKIILSLLLCYAGLLVMYSSELKLNDSNDVKLGMGLILLCSFSFAIYAVGAKYIMYKVDSISFTSLAMLGSSAFALFHYFYVYDFKNLLMLPLEVWGYGFLIAVFSTVIPSYMITSAYVLIGASKTSIVGTIGPVITIVLSVLILSETLSLDKILGILLILFGVYLSTYGNKK